MNGVTWAVMICFATFMLCVCVVYVDSLNIFYYRKVYFQLGDIEVTYWYKWKLFESSASPFFIWRKVKLINRATNMESEYILNPVRESGHTLYFYFDHNYKTHTGMLFDVLVIRDVDISMGFDVYSLDYLKNVYVYERRVDGTEYLGMIECGIYHKSEGLFRSIQSRELNY